MLDTRLRKRNVLRPSVISNIYKICQTKARNVNRCLSTKQSMRIVKIISRVNKSILRKHFHVHTLFTSYCNLGNKADEKLNPSFLLVEMGTETS